MNIIERSRNQLADNKPFVIFRKPHELKVRGFFQKNDTLFATENYLTSGFVFAPFDAQFPTYILPKNQCEVIEEVVKVKPSPSKSESIDTPDSSGDYVEVVHKALHAILSSELEKVVVSREERVKLSNPDPINVFLNTLSLYPNAFVYLWYHPKEGLWFGATPETFIKLSDNTFETIALASTQSYQGSLEVVWGRKEVKEHQYVVDFIANQLEKSDVRIQNLSISPTYTVRAGNLLHLRADIKGDITSDDIKKLVDALHPTPAVCGQPKDIAKDFILKNEDYNREFYTGYLGEINPKNSSELYVNLRCGKLMNDQVSIYVGGGITEESVIEKEWKETVIKSQTIKKVL